jgi:Fn3 domain-containing protein
MSITTNLDNRAYVKGDETIEITVDGDSAGRTVYYTLDGSTPTWQANGTPLGETKIYNNPIPIIISGLELNENGFVNYNTNYMVLNCKTAEETMNELKLKFIYPPESNPKCLDVVNDNQEYSLVNKWDDEDERPNFKIMYCEEGEEIWKEWKMIPETLEPEKMTAQVDADGVYVHIIEAKLQHKNYPMNNAESLTRTFVYVIKP